MTHTHIMVDNKEVAELHLVYRFPPEPEPVKKLRQGRQDLEVPRPLPNILFQRKCAEEREIDSKLSKSPNPGFRR